MEDICKFSRRPLTVLLKIYVDEVTGFAAERRAEEHLESLSGYVRRLIVEDVRRAQAARAEYADERPEDRPGPGRV